MKKDDTYNLGDIVRWKDSKIIEGYEYGMVIKDPEVVSGGVYKFAEELIEVLDIQDSSFALQHPLMAVTIFSFGEQRVITLYRNPEDVPYQIEKVDFSQKSS
jgi:gamma-glutamylcyclotransferase (GGCT)/AIG2-like uncharacterized protein YtfP